MATVKRSVLGKGLGALLHENSTIVAPTTSEITAKLPASALAVGMIALIPIAQIDRNPLQPRQDFDQQALQELSKSIQLHGIIQPLTVRKLSEDSYELISGERRLKAAALVQGVDKVPAYIREATNDQAMLEMGLVENIQREDLNAIEIALSFQRMIKECALKQEDIADRVGKNRSTITNYLRLLKLPDEIQAAVRDLTISMGHARALISIDNPDQQLKFLKVIIEQGLSVREVEELVKKQQNKPVTGPTKPNQADLQLQKYENLAKNLAPQFTGKIKFRLNEKGKGKIEIAVESQGHLESILSVLP